MTDLRVWRVLLIEDDEDDYLLTRELFDEFTRRESCEVEWIDSFDAGLKALSENRHDVCLLDYQLGAEDGLTLLQHSMEKGCAVPIILLTGSGNPDIDQAAMSQGAADYLIKGEISAPLLERSIRHSLERHRFMEKHRKLAADNARLYEEARRAVEARDEVHRIVVHDLRNPLNNIGLAIQLMERRAASLGVEAEGFLPHLQTQRLSIKRMNRLIEDLLDVARIEEGKLTLNRTICHVAELLDQTLSAHRLQADDRLIELCASFDEDLPPIDGDLRRLDQLFANLVGNALKFTPEEGRIELTAKLVDQAVVFSVSDNGYGISEDQLPHLFDRFWQAQQGSRSGAGLGLAICKGIVEAHEGRIWVESAEGEGTTFSFSIPLYPETELV